MMGKGKGFLTAGIYGYLCGNDRDLVLTEL